MKNSEYIRTISVNDPRSPGEKIELAIHQVDGGYIGVDTNYIDEVANYVINPFQECEFVKLTDPQGNDEEIDPPLKDDVLMGFLQLLVAFDAVANESESFSRQEMLSRIMNRTGMNSDDISMLLGLAKEVLVDINKN